MKKKILSFCLLSASLAAQAQAGQYWSATQAAKIKSTAKVAHANQQPENHKLFSLDMAPLRAELFGINAGKKAKSDGRKIISIPNANGQIEDFEVFEASNFEPELQAKFPEIRAYSGKGITDPNAVLKLSIAPEGLKTMILRADEASEYIEPYTTDAKVYSVYKSQRNKGELGFKCSTKDKKMLHDLTPKAESAKQNKRSSAKSLYTMRLALSCNAEYANYFKATTSADVAKVMAAFNATITRCNGIFEKDLGLHLNIIPTTTNVIYYNPSTDPYSDAAGLDNWNGELMNTLHDRLGDNTFDIGHLLTGNGSGGDAGCIGCVCSNDMTVEDEKTGYPGNYKGAAYTAPGDNPPQGDAFDVDYVAHEIGHQLGGMHTFTFSPDNNEVQVEIGTGISIMGYAGLSGSVDIANRSIDSFHGASIEQIQTNLLNKACIVKTNISANNATPTVTACSDITIPISTPFALVALGADTNTTNALTYSWEQIDIPATANLGTKNNATPSLATATKKTGPNFTSFTPSTSGTRFFPKMATVMSNLKASGPLNGGTDGVNSEVLSSIARPSDFRVTVRDNAPYRSTAPISVGQTTFADMTVTTNATGGAFTVTSQAATGITYEGNINQTITWNRGSTTAAPFSATNVDILITYNNGANWTVLLAKTPNDGTQTVAMPNVTQANCRIMVRSAVTVANQVQAYFFNVNTKAFALKKAAVLDTDDSIKTEALQVYPNPSQGDVNIKFSPKNNSVGIKVYDMLGNLVFTQDYPSVGEFNQAINLQQLSKGTYMLAIFDGDNQENIQRLIIK